MQRIQSVKALCAALAACLLVVATACAPKVDNGGYVRETPIKDQVTIGKSTQEDVQNTLGSPSAQSTFGEEIWYYITARKEAYAFMRPEIVEQEVVRIEFDKSGVVSKVESYNQDSSKEFDLVKRTTPTEGHTLGFFEQILGNIGRFNAPGGRDNSGPGRRGGNR